MTDKQPFLTAKQEATCLAFVLGNDGKGMSQAEAYRACYDVGKDTKQDTVICNASQLFTSAHIAARVAELRNRYAEAGEVTVKTIIGKLDKAAELAHKEGQAGAAVQAAMGTAKLVGLLIDRYRDESEQPDAAAAIDELAGDYSLCKQVLTLLFAGNTGEAEIFIERGGQLLHMVGKQ